ncbi:MAG: DUF2783 domain-containing protein [Betaproteobacteria bacterium]|nr:DUF2783 domain-containing protein [Betaproteobacteria bacterium]NBT11231.1 DUF2783 domain-containing protein [Betaproteobacteria bacterium]NBU50169.1 DUF2783 domain-containing protein [Betaproteobacteria bacterium]NBX96221.1 DUF2783 domain-containing protein [Betaproteobacteria bacterium]
MSLCLSPNFHEPGRRDLRDYSAGDEFYQALVQAHHGLDDEQSLELNARLILLLSNHIGDLAVLREALRLARQAAEKPTTA